MNKTILATLVALAMLVGVGFAYKNANAGFLTNLRHGGKTYPSINIQIDATGNDLRGYLFSIPEEGVRCLFVAGSRKGGLNCWELKTK